MGIGILGINSLNQNSSNSEIESIVNEIDVAQAKNLALEAQYQYYIDHSYLDSILGNLIDRQEWQEMRWIDAHMWSSGKRVKIGGKEYVKLVYRGPVPEPVKRDYMAFRVGGTLTYHKDCYITDIRLVKGSDYEEIELSEEDKVEGSGLDYVDSEITQFDQSRRFVSAATSTRQINAGRSSRPRLA